MTRTGRPREEEVSEEKTELPVEIDALDKQLPEETFFQIDGFLSSVSAETWLRRFANFRRVTKYSRESWVEVC